MSERELNVRRTGLSQGWVFSRLEDHTLRSAPGLGAIHRLVRVMDELDGGGFTSLGICDSDAGTDEHDLFVNGERLLERRDDAFGETNDAAARHERRAQQTDLVATQATGALGGAQRRLDPPTRDGEQRVARLVAKSIVDL